MGGCLFPLGITSPGRAGGARLGNSRNLFVLVSYEKPYTNCEKTDFVPMGRSYLKRGLFLLFKARAIFYLLFELPVVCPAGPTLQEGTAAGP